MKTTHRVPLSFVKLQQSRASDWLRLSLIAMYLDNES